MNRLGNNCLEYDPYVKHYKWLSPSSPGARQHVKEKAAALAALDGLASVHLDFIRYNDAILGRQLQRDKFHIEQDTYRAEYDFGYHPEAIEKFKAIFGYSPLELKQPWLSPEWLQFRLNEVSSLVNEIVAETHAAGKQVSAAVFPYPTRARMTVYQDWPAWDIDIVCPMNYNSFYLEGIDWIGFSVENGVRETQGKNLYVSGLFVPDLSAEELYQAAKLSIEKGAKGVNFFNARSLLRGDQAQGSRAHQPGVQPAITNPSPPGGTLREPFQGGLRAGLSFPYAIWTTRFDTSLLPAALKHRWRAIRVTWNTPCSRRA